MWSEFCARRAACILAFVLALPALAAVPADAKGKAKKPRAGDEFGLSEPFRLSPLIPAPAPPNSTTPLRFFTINQVLAKREARGGEPMRFAALPSSTATDAPSGEPLASSDEPFGLAAFRAPEGLLWVKWRGVEREMTTEAPMLERCRAEPETCPSPAALRFLAFTATARTQSGRERLEAVSHALNAAVVYTSDMAQHGVADRWTAPLVTLTSGRGDCEDYAIAKYAVLRAAGVAPEDLRIVLLRDTLSREDHAVLAARDAGRWFILDNRRAGFYLDRALPHYMPLFALDHRGVQVFAAPYASRPLHDSEKIAPATADANGSGGQLGDAPFLL